MQSFATPEPIRLFVRAGAGQVNVEAVESERTTVELTPLNPAGEEAVARAHVEQRRDMVVVHVPRGRGGLLRQGASVAIEVSCPAGSRLDVRTDSSDLRATGSYTEVTCASGSGDLEVDNVTSSAKLKTGSGAVFAGRVDGTLVVSSGSGVITLDGTGRSSSLTVGTGDITIGELCGEVVTKTGSGSVSVDRLEGALATKTGSGDLTVRRAGSGSITATGASGTVTIGVAADAAAWLDVSTLSGRLRQELDQSDAPPTDRQRVEITAHTVSGDLTIHRA